VRKLWSTARQLLVLSNDSEWLESRRKLDKDWVNQLKGIQLKYKDIIAQCKEKPYPKIKTFIEEKEKGRSGLTRLQLS
jgi:hypothetical protein